MPDYCHCEKLDCDRSHEPASPGVRALFDGKVAIQKLSHLDLEGLSEPLKFAISTQAWSIVHKAFRLGIEAGKLLEREDAVAWLKTYPYADLHDGYGHDIGSDGIEQVWHALEAGAHQS